ncbi:MAG: ATP-binding protein [Myxococcales bacterium]|nr:ATP-binding protein [Myxococcales bacterium]
MARKAPERLMLREEAEIKFFIHDLRVQKFFHHLISIHQNLIECYQEHGLEEVERHQDYVERLKRAREKSHEARQAYELSVKSHSNSEQVIETGREYIDATLEACRVALLPHWRDFDAFVEPLPPDAACRNLSSAFNEVKAWVGAIDRRIVNFIRFRDDEVPMRPLAASQRIRTDVENHLRYYVRSAGKKRLEIKLGRLDSGFIFADQPRFDRLLFNLVMNAVDAMRDKRAGVITIEVKSTDLVTAVEISDEGKGMAEDKIEHILHSEKDMTGELHSLGFRFVRQTVNAFNGKIYIESEVGKGTTIRLVFPRYHAEEEAELQKPSTTHSPTGEALPIPEAVLEHVEQADRAGEIVLDDYCKSLAPLPGCIFSIGVNTKGVVDHFVHKAYDPDWMMGHDDLAPMLYEAVFRGRYETDDKYGSALILKSPHKIEEYYDLRNIPELIREPQNGNRMLHNEYIRIARHLIHSGMAPDTRVYITYRERLFTAQNQMFSDDPFPLSELAEHALL